MDVYQNLRLNIKVENVHMLTHLDHLSAVGNQEKIFYMEKRKLSINDCMLLL